MKKHERQAGLSEWFCSDCLPIRNFEFVEEEVSDRFRGKTEKLKKCIRMKTSAREALLLLLRVSPELETRGSGYRDG